MRGNVTQTQVSGLPTFGGDLGPELENGDGVLVEMPAAAIGEGGRLEDIRLFRLQAAGGP